MNNSGNFRLDFIGIGAPKAGTTWMANNLRKHPDIFIPEKKELIYFNRQMPFRDNIANYRFSNELDWYHDFFKPAGKNQIQGEISPQYFHEVDTYRRIFEYNPNIKILVILRNPYDRLRSSHAFSMQLGEFGAISLQNAILRNPGMVDASLYSKKIKQLYKIFAPKQVKIVFFEHMISDPQAVFKEILDFLAVKEYYPDDLAKKANPTKSSVIYPLNLIIRSSLKMIHRHKLWGFRRFVRVTGIARVAENLRSYNRKGKKKQFDIDPALERKLKNLFLPDIEKLEQLLGKDLSMWKV